MKLIKSYKFYLFLIVAIGAAAVCIHYIVGSTGAWLTDVDNINVSYTVGILDFDLTELAVDGQTQITVEDIILKGGTKIYLKQDSTFEDVHFNEMVEPVSIRLTNTGNIPMVVSASFIPPETTDTGILYMFLENTDISQQDYRSIILNNLGITNSSSLNYATLSSALATYNAAAFQSSKSVRVIPPQQSVIFTTLLWADYDYLDTSLNARGTEYLQTNTNLFFRVNASQQGGGAPLPEEVL